MKENCSCENASVKVPVLVTQDDADLLRKVHLILKGGNNVEIRRDPLGKPKVYQVSKKLT